MSRHIHVNEDFLVLIRLRVTLIIQRSSRKRTSLWGVSRILGCLAGRVAPVPRLCSMVGRHRRSRICHRAGQHVDVELYWNIHRLHTNDVAA